MKSNPIGTHPNNAATRREQYMLPTVHEWYDSDPAANILVSLERLLTLAVPNTYFWLLGFYAFFHLTLNLLAEVRFVLSFFRVFVFCDVFLVFSFFSCFRVSLVGGRVGMLFCTYALF